MGRGLAFAMENKNGFKDVQQLFRRPMIQILQHAVVGENLHLVVGKNDREKFPARARAMPRLEDSGGSCAAMMPVGDVKGVDLGKLRFDELDIVPVGNRPGGMS